MHARTHARTHARMHAHTHPNPSTLLLSVAVESQCRPPHGLSSERKAPNGTQSVPIMTCKHHQTLSEGSITVLCVCVLCVCVRAVCVAYTGPYTPVAEMWSSRGVTQRGSDPSAVSICHIQHCSNVSHSKLASTQQTNKQTNKQMSE